MKRYGGKDSPQYIISSYHRRQRALPFIVGALAVLLVVIGIVILVVWLTGSNAPAISLFATKTPTPTITNTPTPVTPTLTPSLTPTETLTPTITLTLTPSGPQEYTVQEFDTCWDIAVKFNVDLLVLLALNNFPAGTCPISVGQKILIPAPNQALPTETPIPADLPRGTKIVYTIKTGETLAQIASRFNSTVDSIKAENKIENANQIVAGQVITILVNIVTPTPTKVPTSTGQAGAAQPTTAPTPLPPTDTPTPTATVGG